MPDESQSRADEARAWLKNTPASAQAAFEMLAAMQLLQEVADQTETVLQVSKTGPLSDAEAGRLFALTIGTATRLVEVSRRQIDTIRAVMQV